ncbi:MAG: hypothetical protein CO118_07470 [Flavobacteriales bacterium CG_4_9_14_3_um_filter_32_8]|nr:MAG: hypothetical protein CO118_07470 [Flavobacteriales bacterium CG_4_9_14_3_um_filter_32_8]
MKYNILSIFLVLSSVAINLNATTITQPQDTIIPSKHKFISNEVFVPKTYEATKLISMFMDYLKEGKHSIGFVHEDELAMIEEKKLTEKRLFFDSYEVISLGKRMATIKVYTVRGASISCKLITLRYYQNMQGFFYLVPGKVETFEKKMGDITLKEVFLNTWTSESPCN